MAAVYISTRRNERLRTVEVVSQEPSGVEGEEGEVRWAPRERGSRTSGS